MISADGRHALVFNGEIFNYLELADELAVLGCSFHTGTDTEVLLTALRVWGVDCLQKLVGMFAFVFIDLTQQRVIVARDHFGVKPFHFAMLDGALVFASELSTLLRWPGISRQVNNQSLYNYLAHGFMDVEHLTMFRDVSAMPPAHYAELDLRSTIEVSPVRYWFPERTPILEISFEEAHTRLRELFLDSVALHMRSDVPVGALLSGGLDSSSVVMAMRHIGGREVDLHTFSYIGDDGAVSEEKWIDIVNRAAHAIPHKLRLRVDEFSRDFAWLVEHEDEPFGSVAIYAQARLFGAAREAGIPVVLSGTGGDEMFAGYADMCVDLAASFIRAGQPHKAFRLWMSFSHCNASPWRATGRYAVHTASRFFSSTLVEKVRNQARPWLSQTWIRATGVGGLPSFSSGSYFLRDRIRRRLSLGMADLLRFEDRGSMAASIEARVPILNHQLAEFALAVPEEYVLGTQGRPKHLFREAMRGIVPDEIRNRTERVAFSVPSVSWLPQLPGLEGLLHELYRVPALESPFVEEISRRVAMPQRLKPQSVGLWWRLIGLAAWTRRFDPVFT